MTISTTAAYVRIGTSAPIVRHQVETVYEVARVARPILVQHDIDVVAPDGAKTRHPGIEVWC